MEKAVLDDVIRRLLTDGRNRKQVKLSEAVIKQLCLDTMTIFLSQPNLLRLHAPITICGDVHGQFQTLLKIFKVGGYPPKSTYLFLGNYVDQGTQGLETICLLFAYKVRYPDRIFLLRGNHEDAKINRTHGFYDECKRRFNDRLWKTLTDCFNCLPVAALIEKKIFCIHAGLSPELYRPEEIDDIRRPTEIPDHGLLCDLLWSDPHPETIGWGPSERGVSCSFGPDKVEEFLYKNDLDLICRSHQVVEDGYNFFVERKFVTISSTSDYRGEFVNAGALLIIDKTLVPSFKTFRTQVARSSNPIMKRLKEALEISSSTIVSKEEMVISDVVEKEYVDSPHISSSPSSLVCSQCCASQSSLDDFVKMSSVGSIDKTCQTEMRESSQVFPEAENIEEQPTLPTYDIVDQASGHDACSAYDTQSIDQACPYTGHDEEILDEFMGIDLSDFSRWESESLEASTVAPVVIVPSTLADMAHHGSLAQLNNGEAAYKDTLKQLRILRTVDFSSSVPVAAIHDCLVAITKALEFHGLSPSRAAALLNLRSNLLPVASQVFSHCQAMKPLKEAVEAVEKQSTEWKQKKELLEERTKALKRKKEEYVAKDLELIRLQAELVRLVEEATELKASVDRDLSSVRAINDEVVVGFAELKKAKAALPTYRKQLAEEESVVEEHSRLLSLMFDMVEDL